MKRFTRKRLLSMLLCFVVCLSMCIPAYASTTQPTIKVANVTADPGAAGVNVAINIEDNPGLTGARLAITYDSNLTLTRGKNGSAFSDAGISMTPPGEYVSGCNFVWDATTIYPEDITDGTILTLTFSVSSSAPSGTKLPISVTYETKDIVDNSGTHYSPTIVNGGITTTGTAPVVEGYTAGITTTNTAVELGESVAVSVNTTKKGATKFASSELKLNYDKDKLTYVSVTGLSQNSSSVKNDVANGILVIEECGADKDLGTGVFTVNFTAKAEGEATVTLTSAAFSDKVNAEKADLIAATVNPASVKTTITESYEVTLPEVDYVHGNSSVTAGESYTLSVDNYAYYDYTVTAKMGGQAANITDNKDGSYTVANVSGALVFTVSRTAKQYAITFTTTTGVTGLPTGVKGTFGTEYSYTIPTEEHWSYSVASAVYTGTTTAVEYSINQGKLIIAGDKITAPITVTIDKVQADATVTVEGNAASDATGYTPYATPGTKYTLTVNEDSKYDYSVTATVNTSLVSVTKDAAGKYSIAGIDVKVGTIVFTVNKTLKADGLTVTKYLQLNGKAMWLVKYTTSKLDGSLYTCNENNMFWNDQYAAYCYLVIGDSDTAPTITVDKLAIVTGTAVEISGFDVNMSGKVDANDAQLIYNMYTAMYSDFTSDVILEKFLLADVNASGTIDMTDVAAVINQILNPES